MEVENIYEDLDDFILERQVEQVQENNKELQQTIEKLEETTKKFTEEISELKKINQNLERNISALFKTAKNEIERKDTQLTELRKELNGLKFRRGNNKKGPKREENNGNLSKELEIVKCVIEQKDRIIQSLTNELEDVKKGYLKQEKQLKRNASYFEDDDLRSKLGKKRKHDDADDCKRDKSKRLRSRSKSREARYNSSLKPRFDKKRSIRRHRSGSFEKRRSSMIEKHRSRYENSKYSKSRSRSPSSHKKHNKPLSEESCRTNNSSKYPEKINKLKSRSRSSSMDRKKYYRQNDKAEESAIAIKCEKKVIHNHLMKEDSGMSSCNSQTSELLPKCDEIKVDLLEDLKVEDLEEGEIDCTLEDINSEEDDLYFKEKSYLKKGKTQKTSQNAKIDKKEMRKSNVSIENPKKKMENKIELKSVKEVKPAEKEHKNTDPKTNNVKAPELRLEFDPPKTVIVEETEINDFKNPHDVLELMVQSNYLDDLDEELVKMRLLEDDKRKKRKEDKDRISKLRSAISECKQNIELLEHNIYSDEETETEDELSRTGMGFCVEERIEDTKQNNLVLKIRKGSIVASKVEPKTDTLKDDKKQNQIAKADDVLDKNQLDQLDSSTRQEIVDEVERKIQNDVLDTNPIDIKHIQKPKEMLDKNPLETNKKENTKAKIQKSNDDADIKPSTKHVKNKIVKDIPKIENSKSSKDSLTDKDVPIKKNKSLEDHNRKKRKNSNEKCNKIVPPSKEEPPEKLTTNKKTETSSMNDKSEASEPTKTQCVEFRPKLAENITEHELLEAISTIVDDVKKDASKFEQNFANITNLESVPPDGQNQKPAIAEAGENKFDVEHEKKENVSQEVSDKETRNATESGENEPQRKTPLKARRRRAFICIT